MSVYLLWPASRSMFFELILNGHFGKHGSTFGLPDSKQKEISTSDLKHDIDNKWAQACCKYQPNQATISGPKNMSNTNNCFRTLNAGNAFSRWHGLVLTAASGISHNFTDSSGVPMDSARNALRENDFLNPLVVVLMTARCLWIWKKVLYIFDFSSLPVGQYSIVRYI